MATPTVNSRTEKLVGDAPHAEWEHELSEAFRKMVARGLNLDAMHQEFRRELILWALWQNDCNQCRAARMLQTHRNNVNRMFVEYVRKPARIKAKKGT